MWARNGVRLPKAGRVGLEGDRRRVTRQPRATAARPATSLPLSFSGRRRLLDALPDEGQVVAVVITQGARDGFLVLGVVSHVASSGKHFPVLISPYQGDEELRGVRPNLVHAAVNLTALRAELVRRGEAVKHLMTDQDVRVGGQV